MPYTLIVLQVLAAQFVLGFIGALLTAKMSIAVNYNRQIIMRWLWGLTGYVLIAAIVWDIYQLFA